MSGEAARYRTSAIVLHWVLAAAFAVQIGLGWQMDGPRGPAVYAAFQLHKSIGITILLLTIVRLALRLIRGAPAFPPELSRAEWIAAHGVHIGFYALLLGLPLTGWLMVSTSEVVVPTMLYGAVPWPHLPGTAGLAATTAKATNAAADTAHGLLVYVSLVLIVLHVAGALKHHFVDRAASGARMVPGPVRWHGVALIAIVAAFGGLLATGRNMRLASPTRAAAAPAPAQVAPVATPTAAPEPEPTAIPTPTATVSPTAEAPPSRWTVRRAASSLRFATRWSGGPIEGGFGSWTAAILFDPAALDASSVDVTIDMSSVTAEASDQQSALPGDDWFAVATHPTARFRANRFTARGGDRYEAAGTLAIRGVSRPMRLPFTLKIDGDVATMTGRATIDRTAFGVGQGEWSSTSDIPANVTVSVAIKADRTR